MISWSHFLILVASLLGVYYSVLVCFYGQSLFKKLRGALSFFYTGKAVQNSVPKIDDLNDKLADSKTFISLAKELDQQFIQNYIPGTPQPEILFALRQCLHKHQDIKQSVYFHAVTNMVKNIMLQHYSISVCDAELEQLWE